MKDIFLLQLFIISLYVYVRSIPDVPTEASKYNNYRPDYMLVWWPHLPWEHDMKYWLSRPSKCICYPSAEDTQKCYQRKMGRDRYTYEKTVDTVIEWSKPDHSYYPISRSVVMLYIKSDFNKKTGFTLAEWEMRQIHWAVMTCSFPCFCK